MDFKELLLKNRSYRRFYQEEPLDMSILEDIIADVRVAPSAANLQPLKFVLVNDRGFNNKIFPCMKWAGYLKDWPGPAEGERPAAYIVILGNRELSANISWDYGIAMQTILLSAVAKGYGGCAIAAFDKEKVREILAISPELEVAAVIALGKPKEKVVIEDAVGEDIKYWRDVEGIHHVPKRKVADLIYKGFGIMKSSQDKCGVSETIIKQLGLKYLDKESGYYKKVARSCINVCQNWRRLKANNSIYYLLNREKPINYLHWLSPDDTHILCEGGPVDYYVFHPDCSVEHHVVGKDLKNGERPMLMIPGGSWKALKLRQDVEFALMVTVLTPEWTQKRVKIGAGQNFIDKYANQAAWATPDFLRELIGPNFK
jgi:nitroreductase/predicted cupin superfamily sugar epimerase